MRVLWFLTLGLGLAALVVWAGAGACTSQSNSGTGLVREPRTTETPPTPGLTAVLSAGSRPDRVVVEYRNQTADEVRVSEQVLITGCLALEVRNAGGQVMYTVPPSPPWPRDEGVAIPAGGSYRREYDLDMFNPPLQPGRYWVRVRIPGWSNEPLSYTVTNSER